jgi:hypothetical protein
LEWGFSYAAAFVVSGFHSISSGLVSSHLPTIIDPMDATHLSVRPSTHLSTNHSTQLPYQRPSVRSSYPPIHPSTNQPTTPQPAHLTKPSATPPYFPSTSCTRIPATPSAARRRSTDQRQPIDQTMSTILVHLHEFHGVSSVAPFGSLELPSRTRPFLRV